MEQYINKDAVVHEIERLQCPEHGYCLDKLLDFIDTLEVKEVDINKEISQFIDANFEKATIGHKLSLRRIAKHFFELGFKTQ